MVKRNDTLSFLFFPKTTVLFWIVKAIRKSAENSSKKDSKN